MTMKLSTLELCAAFLLAALLPAPEARADRPDSLYLYTYATDRNDGRDGLHCAWSADGVRWKKIGDGHAFVKCDYGRWGSEKRMLRPTLWRDPSGRFHALWSLNERSGALAYTSSDNLIDWLPQEYPALMSDGNCLQPEADFDPATGRHTLTWLSVEAGDTLVYASSTSDFREFAPVRNVPAPARTRRLSIPELGPEATGNLFRVPAAFVEALENDVAARLYKSRLYAENARSDARTLAGLQPVTGELTVRPEAEKAISPMLIGIFFEDISSAADGGLYAELIQNRDFEYDPADKRGQDPAWNALHSWRTTGEEMRLAISTEDPIHPNNPHYAVLTVERPGAALVNAGFDGIPLEKGARYDLSLFARRLSERSGSLEVALVSADGRVCASTRLPAPGKAWKKLRATLTATDDATDAVLTIKPSQAGAVALDMVSLFPQRTFRGRANGLRADLAQTIAELHPRFVRFPGGCVAHGDGLENIYRWKNTIGPLEARKPQRNIWGYHQSAGLGYHEYFLFCEDLGAEPVPVIAAGVPCQNSSNHPRLGGGQQGGIPLEEMDDYIQDILDLVEYANGDRTTEWGRKRAEAGHPEPFGLKYIGIGNEDLISEVFAVRFKMIYDALRRTHPEITVIGTVGPFYEGSDYDRGWELATQWGLKTVDEHYYQSPGWFIHNQEFYDAYDRSKPHVYLGEYASQGNTLYNALAEAAYLCGVERNGDVVEMTSYAPLLAKEGHTNWNPDLIYFNNTEIKPTANYHVQRLFGQNSGTRYLESPLALETGNADVARRVASSVVIDRQGDLIIKLVNILPAELTLRLSIPAEFRTRFGSRAATTTLTGEAAERGFELHDAGIDLSASPEVTLPAYSLSVIRLPRLSE